MRLVRGLVGRPEPVGRQALGQRLEARLHFLEIGIGGLPPVLDGLCPGGDQLPVDHPHAAQHGEPLVPAAAIFLTEPSDRP